MADVLFSVAMGLFPALCWGVVDILAKRVVDRTSVPATLVILNAISLVPLMILAWPTTLVLSGADLPIIALLCVANLAGGIFLYLAFQQGKLSVVSPIAATYPVLTVVLAASFLGSAVAGLQYVGMAVAVAGVYLLAREEENGGRAGVAGLIPALGAVLGFGVTFYLFKPIALLIGVYWAVVLPRIVTVGSLLPVSAGEVFKLTPRTYAMLAAMGLLDAAAYTAYNFGVTDGDISIVAPLSGLFFAFTVVLAHVTLRERLRRLQVIGVVVIALGVFLIAR
ncbi:MAG: DMT family transporter [Euryarchaeota archaeon]|nr:DMT family transporter [Euryarchaeota archaeon]